MINILLVEDHNIVRSGIKMLLETEADFNIIGEATNGLDALALVKELDTIDIMLTDINMEGIDGITLIKEVKQLNPAISVVILSMHDNEKYVLQSFAEEASGYILKSVSSNELIFALRFIASGQKYVCSEIVSKMIATLLENKHFQIDTEKSEIEFSSRELE
ncbi:MAG: response regulator transcription factor, partial [Pedobacter sp.]